MDQDSDYEPLWEDYRRRRRWKLVLFLSYVPVVGAFALLVVHLHAPEALIPASAICGMVAFAVAQVRVASWRCPRCREAFFRARWYHNGFAKKCVHCGLRKWSAHGS
jgi:hypothetical protein